MCSMTNSFGEDGGHSKRPNFFDFRTPRKRLFGPPKRRLMRYSLADGGHNEWHRSLTGDLNSTKGVCWCLIVEVRDVPWTEELSELARLVNCAPSVEVCSGSNLSLNASRLLGVVIFVLSGLIGRLSWLRASRGEVLSNLVVDMTEDLKLKMQWKDSKKIWRGIGVAVVVIKRLGSESYNTGNTSRTFALLGAVGNPMYKVKILIKRPG